MQIKSIEPIPIRLPMSKPVVMAGETVSAADNMLLKIISDTGLTGWGEAAAAPTMTGETLESMVAAVSFLIPSLTGRDIADIEGAIDAMDGRMFGNTGAKAAIEIALHDLAGKAAGVPAHALIGSKPRERMPLLGVIGGGDREGDLADAVKKKSGGYGIFKIKVGIGSAADDAARTRDICKVLGSGYVISADANQGFDTAQAVSYVRAVTGSGLDFFEQPVAAHDIDGMAAVAAASDILVGADEGIHSLDDIRLHHTHKAARGVSLKAIKLGGMRAVTEAGRLCDQLGMSVNLACKTGESSIACAAALHIASVLPNISWGLTLTNGSLAQDITGQPVKAESGHASRLDRPGLGIDVDEDRVQRHRLVANRLN